MSIGVGIQLKITVTRFLYDHMPIVYSHEEDQSESRIRYNYI